MNCTIGTSATGVAPCFVAEKNEKSAPKGRRHLFHMTSTKNVVSQTLSVSVLKTLYLKLPQPHNAVIALPNRVQSYQGKSSPTGVFAPSKSTSLTAK